MKFELPEDFDKLKCKFDNGEELTTVEMIRLAKAGIPQNRHFFRGVKVASKVKTAKLAKLDEFMNPQPKGKKGGAK